MDRRKFIGAAAGAAALGVVSWSYKTTASALGPDFWITLGHLAGAQSPKDEESRALSKNIISDLGAILKKDEGPVVTVLHSGNWDPAFSHDLGLEIGSTPVNGRGKAGFAIFQPLAEPHFLMFDDARLLLDWLDKKDRQSSMLFLLTDEPIDQPWTGAAKKQEAGRLEMIRSISAHPEVLLVLSGGGRNRAALLPGARTLSLCTAPALEFPCGSRIVKVGISGCGVVEINSAFIQTRYLTEVEKSYQQGVPDVSNLKRLGSRADRHFVVHPGYDQIQATKFPATPNLAPWPATAGRLDLALVTDTHLVLDKFLEEGDAKTFNLIGHALEADSKALIADVLGQVAEGRHRIEFFDQVFAKDPMADRNFLNRPVDGMLVLGDVTENGRREEAEAFKAMLDGLPKKLRERTLLVPGNHDLWNEFSPGGMATDRRDFCDLFSAYGLARGTDYIVELSDWCTVIMLDTIVATVSSLGLTQERIDWIEDQLERQKGKMVLIASHHDLYQLSLVPPALFAYLRTQSHFTGKKSAVREQLHRLFAKHNCVKLCLSGHYHSVVADEFKKAKGVGDPYTVHLQTPCVTEYPSGYRVLSLVREGNGVRADYCTAYTRLFEIRQKSLHALGYRIAGTKPRVPPWYGGTQKQLQKQGGFFGDVGFLDPYDLIKLNMRGFKDGTANAGRGNGKLHNIYDRVSFTL